MRKPPVIVLPDPSPHWHPPGCGCELARPYIRVSKVGTREEVKSPAYQMTSIEAYAKRANLRLLPPIADIDKSGRTFRKRSVDGIIAEIVAGKYSRIVLWKWSRWARNEHESTTYVKRVKDAGGRVDSATEDYDQESAMGRFNMDLNLRMDQLQSELISESWVNAQDRRRDAGLPHSGRARFGYRYIKIERSGQETEKKYVIDKEQAEFLRATYVGFNGGASFNKLAVAFNEAGYKTTLDGTWTPQGLARMMDTGFAAGLIRERSKPADAPANSITAYDVWRPGAHESIIEPKVWKDYKKIRFERAQLPPRSRKARHALSAILFCALCRRRLVTKYAGAGRTHQWQCVWQKAFHPGVAVTVNNRLTMEAVRDWVRDIVGGKIDIAAAQAEAAAEFAAADLARGSEQTKLKMEIAALDDKIEKLVDYLESAPARAKEKITARLEEYQRAIDELTVRLEPEQPEARRSFGESDQSALRELDAVWDELPPEVLREALAKLVSRIEVSPRSESSTRKSVADRVRPIGVWELPELEEWRRARSA